MNIDKKTCINIGIVAFLLYLAIHYWDGLVGLFNLFLAAAFAQTGMEAGEVTELLDEASPEAFRFEMDSVFWRDRMAVVAHVRNMRHLFALSFGSCSFVEPVAELRQLGLIP